jgi:hypothetical protein
LTGGTGHLTGQVSFRLFRNGGCSGRSASAGTTTLPSGSITSSAVPMNLAGTYYWQAEYGGDTANAPSITNCGAQKVVVPRSGVLGLPSTGKCVSVLTTRLRVGKRPARAIEVFGNGKLVGYFTGKIHLRIRGREKVAVIASSARNAFGRKLTAPNLFRQQSRTYRAC